MTQIHSGSGPTALRILLGSQLRKLRENRGISREEAGKWIRASESKISRMERGRVGFKERDVSDLLTLYGVEDEATRNQIMDLVNRANEPGWWYRYNDLLPSWFQAYVGLEEAASRIRTYEVQFVPGLLQTKEYARAVIMAGARPEEIARRVQMRLERQLILERENPPMLWAVIDEAALRRPIGGADVMRGQLRHLIEMMERPNITIQIVPFSSGGHAAEGGAFSILRFADPELPDIVYVEQLASALYLDKPEELDRYTEVMERLCAVSTTPSETVDMLHRLMAEL
ncbi:transcriptional regulator [Thermobispora bispora]|uniref:Helix-turn-helix domain protein n=1 Tax=Thermobispora bispora (strain ATCC 19993 / DSM 43833 / CBS 139.67 / JCM 10125 / KCTC 9307 / NBRC 14880 / R51) TaxID=469371 RepID=D6Y4K6_THEBD|nr:helix-turn-helix transcriptional regulator [Thermobispora bispora]MBO2475471.1 XRE family transcriptional regulator [Actinomycetales bacterium]MDI9581347.1 helix-turn-helix transcriptional regulator [Thermobispora sp.]ADG89182.1 helix-turn-helix domain protein [Thermobispora bispora DSM 43833]MBX6166481.1 helix-turn-helix domain-containing protein [Thermobispora bispora]QSI48888.1 XRE family transcriptional regulator [Thermobispora bispora]